MHCSICIKFVGTHQHSFTGSTKCSIMKYILALFVLLAAYIPANIADPSKEIEPVHNEMDHGVCVFKSRGEWEIPNNCGEVVGVSSYKKLSKGIKRSWKRSVKQWKRKAKSFAKKGVKRIKKLQRNRKGVKSLAKQLKKNKFKSFAKKGVEIITKFRRNGKGVKVWAKMSDDKLKELSNKLATVRNETIRVSIHILKLLNATLSLLDATLVEASSLICARMYVDKIETLSERSHNELYCLAERNETGKFQDLAKESERELVDLARSSGVTLWDTYKFQAKYIKKIASSAGDAMVNDTRNYNEQIKSIEKTNKKLLWFINISVKKIAEFARITKDKYNEVASAIIGKLEQLINDTVILIETLVRAEIKINNDLAFFMEVGNTRTIEETKKEIQGVYKTFEQINQKNNENFISEVHAVIADAIETCKKTISVKLKHKL